jgi:hypothetical protein
LHTNVSTISVNYLVGGLQGKRKRGRLELKGRDKVEEDLREGMEKGRGQWRSVYVWRVWRPYNSKVYSNAHKY